MPKFIKVSGKKSITMSNKSGNMNKFVYGDGKGKKRKGRIDERKMP